MTPLDGLRILDFTAHAAGPFCTHMLAQLGAECIKVETALRPDIFRRPHPVYGRMHAATFDQVSSVKRSIRLNLKHREGPPLALRLAALSDVVAESFRPGVLDRLGVGYAEMRTAREDIVMVSISASGQSGPDSHFSGYAPMFGAWGGLGYLTGYVGGPPTEIRHVMDHAVGMHAAVATLAALQRRRATGCGCHVDVSARDVAAAFAGDALLRADAGERPERRGNEHEGIAPHGVYPTAEDDRWITIVAGGDEAWAGLLEAMHRTDLAGDPRFDTPAARYRHREDLDREVGAWTCRRSGEESVALLQSHGVAAHVSWSVAELAADEHLRQRAAIVDVDVPGAGVRAAVGSPIRFSTTSEVGLRSGTPELGEAEEYVYGALLGLARRERERLVDDGVIH
ncbi:CoA transferase [Dactylosporangium sp. NPDC051485]|uniref:CaiB/BaiF CoA transferase family protein n=1 Tax=Dactylosporangium sp. NPDC051485 TaxID=3154846 RepID=UPI0034193890